jgi:hypothetical protein
MQLRQHSPLSIAFLKFPQEQSALHESHQYPIATQWFAEPCVKGPRFADSQFVDSRFADSRAAPPFQSSPIATRTGIRQNARSLPASAMANQRLSNSPSWYKPQARCGSRLQPLCPLWSIASGSRELIARAKKQQFVHPWWLRREPLSSLLRALRCTDTTLDRHNSGYPFTPPTPGPSASILPPAESHDIAGKRCPHFAGGSVVLAECRGIGVVSINGGWLPNFNSWGGSTKSHTNLTMFLRISIMKWSFMDFRFC